MDELELELENRIKNLMWTVSGDYALDFKPDLSAFARSRYVALYDGIKQGLLQDISTGKHFPCIW